MAKEPYLGPGSDYYEVVHAEDHLMEDGVRYGSAEPRIATPPLRELTPETSWGFSVVEFASEVLSITLMPWQKALLLRALERREDGSLRFATVIGEVARQSGKSKISQILSLWGMLVRGWPLVLGTAQDLSTAEEVWEGAVAILLDDEELAPLVDKVMRVNGQKSLKLKNGSRYLVKAANRSAGRGLSGQLIVMDELREQRNWNAYSAISKIRQAQSESLVIGISNAGDISSVVLKHLREMAHAALGDPDGIVGDKPPADAEAAGDDELFEDDDTLAIFEWSAVPKCDIRDRDAWAAANPALGWRIKERTIAADARTDPEWVFRTEVLCQWPDGALMGPFPPGAWETGQNVPGERVDGSKFVQDDDKIVGAFDVCIDQSSDRSMYSITAVGKRRDGKDQAELIAYRSGNEWIKDFLTSDERCAGRVRRITGQTRGAPVSSFMAALLEAYEAPTDPFRIETVPWLGADLLIAHQLLYDAVSDGSVRHNMQPQLDVAAGTAATKQLTGGFVIDRDSSPADAAPLVAMCGALWLARKRSAEPAPAPPPPKAVRSADSVPGSGTLTSHIRSVGF
ncbi:hypothetical protein [Curtobacterium flaccumfaciens]|uniref:hypothetical protein n=1 Tax=Curtobacterium flaccumfaciens TaxID=2035 RepID=UPI001BDED2F8|nr:hypothetical protein [Curtobacterium flaccumfaciens]MBT1630443.1 hypothetical protein [Curtobacterium flaccumfaciens pv. oortii]MCX2843923.1 hypothetical protein [Curtobacterium flaccumfaciens pv. oortii]